MSILQPRGFNLSDFHEMAIHLRMQAERSLLMENHTLMVETNGRQAGIESRQFSYSDHLAEKMAEIDFSIFSERKTKKESDT